MKVLLTAKPGIGKSTVLQKFLELYHGEKHGFVVTRIKDEQGNNQGFLATTLDGRSQTIAHKTQVLSNIVVGNGNKVDIDTINEFLIPELQKAKGTKALVVIDEIGRMQSFSSEFLKEVRNLFDSDIDILASIVFDDEPWSLEFKQHPDVKLIEVTIENRDELPNDLIKLFNFSQK